MLVEIRCKAFRTEIVRFQAGLNVVLGDDNATNSIGKSTLLMVIDFCFGGSDLLTHNADLVIELGHHDYFFTFRFDEQEYRFRRGTFQPSLVYVCDEVYEPVSSISTEEYTAFLKQSYKIVLPDLSFRALVGLYLRVWGKDNLSVERPLHVVQNQPAHQCVDNLIKTFDRYETIRDATASVASVESKVQALTAAAKHDIVPNISKRVYEGNHKRISTLEGELEDIRVNLAKYATNISEIVNKEVLELKLAKDQLLAQRLTLSSRLQRVQGNLRDNRAIRSESFRDLVNFFPEINQDRLARVEEFHRGVAKLLRTELRESEVQLELEISRIDSATAEIDEGMSRTLSSIEQPTVIVDRVYEVAIELDNTREANQRFDDENTLRAELRTLRAQLAEEKKKVLQIVQDTVNDGMRRIVTSVFGEDRKSPRLTLQEKSYKFEVYDDTGTGTAYASLVVLDLTVFQSTALPVVAHDTLLFKNIENDSVSRLLQVYLKIEKQSFVALDEIEKYGSATAELLRDHSVIALDNDHVLYTKDWRT
jgi:uncharacterized protein YydD (DUF2326 family)